MSLWTTITNPTHCSWKYSRVLFPAFCKYSCSFRHKTTENLKPSLWLNSTEQILIVHGAVTGFPGERDLSLGGLVSPCTMIHIVLLQGPVHQELSRSPGAACAVLATPVNNRSLVSQLAERLALDSYLLTHQSAELVLSTLVSCQADHQVSTLPAPRLKRGLPEEITQPPSYPVTVLGWAGRATLIPAQGTTVPLSHPFSVKPKRAVSTRLGKKEVKFSPRPAAAAQPRDPMLQKA